MKVVCIDPRTSPLWQALVAKTESSVFHSPSWIHVLTDTYGWEASAYVIVDEAGEPCAGIPLCRIADMFGERIVALPFSDYCDPLIRDAESWRVLIEKLLPEQVPIKLNNDLPKTIFLNVEPPGVVTSAQIEEDSDFAVLDKSVYIATVSEGGKLQIEMRVKNGRGYVAADRNYDEDLPIGYIPVESVHSPVRKVNYSVEAARLGQMTDYEKLMMEVWTNGAITPKDAIGFAAKLVKDHMSIFINFEEPVETVEAPQDTSHDPRLEHLDRSVEELELSVRSYNCLKNANIQTIRELVQKSENEMLKTKNFGRKSLNEIKEILTKMGLSLGMKFDEHGRIIWPPLPSQTAAPSSEDTVGL